MFSLLITLIYLAFISLGLPDSLLGAAWPVISQQFGVDKGLQGVVTMMIAGGTILSSLLSDRFSKRFGAGLVTSVSVAMTAVAMVGFSTCSALWQICLWTIPYGLGAGAVDATLNNFAAVHFSSRHLNWLHCFWGVGASISPYIMGGCLTGGLGWQMGYRIVGIIQFVITAILFCSLPLWKKAIADKNKAQTLPSNVAESAPSVDLANEISNGESDEKNAYVSKNLQQNALVSPVKPIAIRGVWQTLVMFFCYCSAESIAMAWSSSYLVYHRGVQTDIAATFASLFFLGITFGRFICGLFSDKLGDKRLMRIGIAVMIVGVVAVALPLSTDVVALGGLVVFGFGCAPIYPAIIHMTPSRFGEENSQAIVGMQMAAAYTGSTFLPPLFGLTSTVAMWAFPLFLGGFTLLLLFMNEYTNKVTAA